MADGAAATFSLKQDKGLRFNPFRLLFAATVFSLKPSAEKGRFRVRASSVLQAITLNFFSIFIAFFVFSSLRCW